MKCSLKIVVLASLSLFASCASINSQQKHELKEWQAQNVQVEEKKPGLAAGLNVLPGVGDFYNGNIGYGVLNLLAWPLSVLWAPVGGASGAEEVNYYATKTHVDGLEIKRKKIKNELEEAYLTNQITKTDYIIASKKLDNTSLKEFQTDLGMKDFIKVENMNTTETERVPSSAKK